MSQWSKGYWFGAITVMVVNVVIEIVRFYFQ